MTENESWDVRVEDKTVIVELPGGVELDKETGEQINKEFAEATGQIQTKYQLTLLETEDPLSSGLFDEVKKGSEIAAENGITHWAIVINERIKGMAFDSKLDNLNTAVFESRSEAEDWFGS
ncbi:hypothetical protein DVK02_12775 [Halobellus sp. Atlit-31R]|nr:hypothetical protein DVK02_12775 [Halobellus sp. Atlit-31R]